MRASFQNSNYRNKSPKYLFPPQLPQIADWGAREGRLQIFEALAGGQGGSLAGIWAAPHRVVLAFMALPAIGIRLACP
jgi:hypothetical protein